jgi:chloride channel protein, CIC family
VLAPLLIMGGALGALQSRWIPVGDPGLWAMVSMTALMGGTMRSPITAIIFTLELTHDLNVLPGLLVATVAAHTITVLMLRRSILTEKVARRGYHIMREYTVDPLTQVRVAEVMDTQFQTVLAKMTAVELSERIAKGDPLVSRHQAIPIVDDNNRLAGIITRGDVIRALKATNNPELTVLEAGTEEVLVAYPDELLVDAVTRMLKNDIGRLPVVSQEDPKKLVGYLGRAAVMAASLKRLEEEHEREPGWLSRPSLGI